ncbi:LytTR family transcriptional regulator DNA-binding domain-containing protein [Niabella aquatica]
MEKILTVDDELIIANRIKEIINTVEKEVPNFILLGICLFKDKEAGTRIADSMQNYFKSATVITKPIIEEKISKPKSIFLKGRFLEKVHYEDLMEIHFSNYIFSTKEILFDNITVIQSFNDVKRNTILFKFKQHNTFFITGSTIEKILKVLPQHFVQVHQSFVVNLHYATQRNGRYILVANEKIPIGRSFKNAI